MTSAPVVPFATPLLEAVLIRRYKRFLADVRLPDGSTLTVHCPNPGGMRGCAEPGRPVLVSDSANPKRKLRYTLEMIRMGRSWVGVNTQQPNRMIGALLEAGRIPALAGYDRIRREVPCGDSRIDFRLESGSDDRTACCWVEVKNTTWRVPGRAGHAAFPDAVTKRGRRHLEALERTVEAGDRAMILFHVGRGDVRRFRPADDVDPEYGTALHQAVSRGVEILALRFRYGPNGPRATGELPIDL